MRRAQANRRVGSALSSLRAGYWRAIVNSKPLRATTLWFWRRTGRHRSHDDWLVVAQETSVTSEQERRALEDCYRLRGVVGGITVLVPRREHRLAVVGRRKQATQVASQVAGIPTVSVELFRATRIEGGRTLTPGG